MIEAAMDPQPRRQLAALIQKEGVGLADDPQRIKAHLLDACPESRTEVELLVAGAVDGLASRLARSSDTVFRDGEIARAVTDLRRTRRLDQEAAEWVVLSWAWALGVIDQEPSDESDEALADSGGPTGASSLGSASAAASSGPPHFQPPSPRPEPPYQPAGPTPAPRYQQAGSAPPYEQAGAAPTSTPSAPPWGEGTSVPPSSGTSAPPLQPPSPPPLYDATQPVWGTGPQQPGSYPQPWGGAPSGSGAHASGAGGFPPSGPSAPTYAPPYVQPPKRSRGLLVGLVAAAVLAVAGIVLGVVLLGGGDDSGTTTTGPAASPATAPAPTTAAPSSPTSVNLQITDVLNPDIEVWDRVVVYSDGQQVGTLEVSTTSSYAFLNVTAPPGQNNYELEMEITLVDGTQWSLGGRGTLNAYEGATYGIDITPSGSSYEVTLREVQ
jgi:hypothetical protein